MGHRDAQIGWNANGGGDAGHDLKGNAGLLKDSCLLAASAEDERVAPFQPHHLLPFAGLTHKDLVDLILRDRVMAGSLAHIDIPGIPASPHENAVAHQPVVDDHIRLLKEALSLHSDQLHI